MVLPKKFPRVFFCLLLAVLYLLPLYLPSYLAHDVQRWSQHILLLFVLLVLGLRLPQALLGTKNLSLLVVICLLAAANVYFAPASPEYLLLTLLLLGAVLYSRAQVSKRYIDAAVVVLAAVQAMMALSSVVGSIITSEPLHLLDLSLVYSNYRFLSHTQTVWVPLCFAVLCLYNIERRMLLALGGLIVFHWVLIFQLGARASIVGLFTAALLVLLVFGMRAWPLVRRFFMLAALGLVLKLLVFDVLFVALGTPVEDASLAAKLQQIDQPRLQLWHRAWVGIKRSPLLGNGASSFASREQLQLDIATEPTLAPVGAYGAHPHNFYLQLAYEFGLPLTLLFLGAVILLLWRMRAVLQLQKTGSSYQVGLCLWLGLLAVGVDALFSGNFVMPVAQCWIAALFGLSLKWCYENGTKPASYTTAKVGNFWGFRRFFLLLMLGFLMILQGALLWRDLPELKANFDQQEKAFTTGIRNPRFWSYGWH
jgi:O-antigen ligase